MIYLAAGDGAPNLMAGTHCRYVDERGRQHSGEAAPSPASAFSSDELETSTDGAVASGVVTALAVTADGNSVEMKQQSEHLRVTVRYSLEAESPLLRVQTSVRGTGHPGALMYVATPRFVFAPGFANVYEDDHDLYYDGAELEHGRELPCWRVFFRQGHQDGLLLATRSKRQMAHFSIHLDGFDIQPHGRTRRPR